MAETLTALSQRKETFWVGLALFLLGVLTPANLLLGGIGLSRVLIVTGGGILVMRLFVGIVRIIKTTAQAGTSGYREGKRTGE